MRESSFRAGAFASAVAFAAITSAGSIHAQTPEDPPPPVPVAPQSPAEQATRATGPSWYGYQLLMTDAFAAMTLVGAVAVGSNPSSDNGWGVPIGALGGALYIGGGAAVHAVHHHPGKAAASILLRIGAPLAGALVGALVGHAMAAKERPDTLDSTGYEEVFWGAAGLGAGMLSAIVVDDMVLAFDVPARDSGGPAALPPKTELTVSPYAGASPGVRGEAQAALGVTGRF